MKQVKLFLVFIMLSITVFGQDIIIDFSGSGASSEVSTVEVVNLSNCTSIEVPGDGSLNLSNPVGAEEFESIESKGILSYPNPFGNSTNIEFYVNQNDYVRLTISDISGKVVAKYDKELTAGLHSFEFIANKTGMYFINLSGTNFVKSSKALCLSNNSQQAQLTYNEQAKESITEKSYESGSSKEFSFTVGDTLKLKGISGDNNYATVMTVEPTSSETYNFNFVVCTDADGNNYSVVEIDDQTWMAENLRATTYPNGTPIRHVTEDREWKDLADNNTDDAYCFYDNDNTSEYGALYTYSAAIGDNWTNDNADGQGVCPDGWHLPTNAEWSELNDNLGGQSEAGGKLKSTCLGLWDSPNNGGATNETGFTGLPGGKRHFEDASFRWEGTDGHWWTASEAAVNEMNAWYWILFYDNSFLYNYHWNKSNGHSVRCVKD